MSALSLIGARRSIVGWPSGTSIDSQDTMAFCALTGVRSMNEVLPLDRAGEAYERTVMSGKARFRIVLYDGGVICALTTRFDFPLRMPALPQ